MTAFLALAVLLLGWGAGARQAFAAKSETPKGTSGAAGPVVPGVPNLDLSVNPEGLAPVIGGEGLTQTSPVAPGSPEIEAGSRHEAVAPAPRTADLSAAPSAIAQDGVQTAVKVVAHSAGHQTPAPADESDLGRQGPSKRSIAAGQDRSASAPDEAADNPSTLIGVVRHAVEAISKAPGAAAATLSHVFELAAGGEEGPGPLAVAPAGTARPGALLAPAPLESDLYSPDSLRDEFSWMPDLMLAQGREGLERVMGPEAAALAGAEIAARRRSEDVQKNVIQRFPGISKEEPAADAPSTEANPLEAEARRIYRPFAQYRARKKQVSSDRDDEKARDEFWNDPEVRDLARQIADEGVYSSPLQYRRFLLGLDINGQLTRSRMNFLLERFARAYFGDDERFYTVDKGARRWDWKKVALEDKDAANFFLKYIEEAMDVLLLTAPAGKGLTTEALEGHVLGVLEKTAKLLAPVTRKDGVVRRYIKTVGEDGRRSVFFELLQFVAFPGYRLEFSVGLGGSEKAPSVRLLAYPLAALEYFRVFNAVGVRLPVFRVFDAQAVSADINQLNKVKAETNARVALGYMKGFIDRFYPDVASAVAYEMLPLEALREGPFDQALGLLNSLERLGAVLKEQGGMEKLEAWDTALEELGTRLNRTPADPLVDLGRRLNSRKAAGGAQLDMNGWERLRQWPHLAERGPLAGLQELGYLTGLAGLDPALIEGHDIPSLQALIQRHERLNGWMRLEQWPDLATRGVLAGLQELRLVDGLEHWDPVLIEGLDLEQLRRLAKERPLVEGLQRLGLLKGLNGDWNPAVASGMDLARLTRLLKQIDMMRGRGDRHGDGSGSARALEYVAFHIMQNGFNNVTSLRHPNAPHAVVKLGGGGEDGFNDFQRWLVERMRSVMGPEYYLPNTSFSARPRKTRNERVAPGMPRPIFISYDKVGGDPPPYYPMDNEVTTKSGPAWRALRTPATLVEYYSPELGGSQHLVTGLPDIQMLIELVSGTQIPALEGDDHPSRVAHRHRMRDYLHALSGGDGLSGNARAIGLVEYARQPVTPWQGP